MCHYNIDEEGNRVEPETYGCDCGATLITSRHALTSFWCVSKPDDDCEKRDFSNGEEDKLTFLCPGQLN